MVLDKSLRSDLAMELSMQPESTYNVTQRNGSLPLHQIQTRRWYNGYSRIIPGALFIVLCKAFVVFT
ncbi:hypothetical protein GQ600_17139 [Phytophthora cactorum]|nr:hypothetical protein GQ600_17139 [Phytophthora cactorum]